LTQTEHTARRRDGVADIGRAAFGDVSEYLAVDRRYPAKVVPSAAATKSPSMKARPSIFRRGGAG
jgi:hypothetical protein